MDDSLWLQNAGFIAPLTDADYETYLQMLSRLPNDSTLGKDFFKQILDILINWQHEKDQRSYNESWRDEERRYNMPSALLGRLMSTGMSRDAALQLLGSMSGSGGTTASPAQGATGLTPSSLSPSQSRLNRVQANTAIANTFINAVSAATSLVGLGISAPTAIRQASLLGTQERIMQQNSEATGMAGSVMSAVTSAMSQGASPSDSDLQTPDSLTKWIRSSVSQFPNLGDALQLLETNGNGNPYFQRAFTDTFRNWHDSRGLKQSPTLSSLQLKQLQNDLRLQQLNAESITANIKSVQTGVEVQLQELANLQSENELIKANVGLVNSQRELTSQQTEQSEALTSLIGEQTIAQTGENIVNRPRWQAYELKAQDLTAGYCNDIISQLNRWSVMSEPEVLEDIRQTILSNTQYARAFAIWNLNSQSSLNEWATSDPEAFRAAIIYRESNYGDLIRQACQLYSLEQQERENQSSTSVIGNENWKTNLKIISDPSKSSEALRKNAEMLLSTYLQAAQ